MDTCGLNKLTLFSFSVCLVTSASRLPNNVIIPTCPAQDVTLDWSYVIQDPSEQVMNMEWRFKSQSKEFPLSFTSFFVYVLISVSDSFTFCFFMYLLKCSCVFVYSFIYLFFSCVSFKNSLDSCLCTTQFIRFIHVSFLRVSFKIRPYLCSVICIFILSRVLTGISC